MAEEGKKSINEIADAIKSLGAVSKKEAKVAKKNLKIISDSVADFSKKLETSIDKKSGGIEGVESLAEGLKRFGAIGFFERKRITKTLDVLGVSIKKFNRNISGKKGEGVGEELGKMADSVEKLSTIGRRKRKGIIKDLTAIGKAFGVATSGKGGGGGGGSKLVMKEQRKEAEKDKQDNKETQLLLFDTLGTKLDTVTDEVRANKQEEKKGIFGGILGALTGLPALLIGGIKGFLPNWLLGGADILGKALFGGTSLLMGGLKGLMGVGGVLAKGAMSLMSSPLGLIAGAGVLGYMAGDWLYDNLVGPWIDDYRKAEDEGRNEASRNVAKEVTVMTAKGREKVFRANEELAKAFGGKEFITQSELAQYAEAKGSSVEALLEEGNVRAAVAMQTAQGTSRFGMKEEMTIEELAGRNRMEEEREALQRMAAGQEIDEVTGEMRRLDNDERLVAHRKNILMREAQQLFDMEQQMHDLLKKAYPDDETADKASFTAEGVLANAESAWKRIMGHGGEELSQGTPLYHSDVDKLKNAFPVLWKWKGKSVNDSGKKLFLDGYTDNVFYPEFQEYYGKSPGAKWRSMGGGRGIMGDQWNALPGDVPFALGGLVKGPIRGLLGEAGPELVLPLEKAPDVIGGILAKTASNMSAKQVGLQSMSSAKGKAMETMSKMPSINTTTVMNNSSTSYSTTDKPVRDVNGIQYKIAMA